MPNMNISSNTSTENLDGNYNLSNDSVKVITRYQNLMKGFTGNVLGGANHDQRHCRDYSEKPQVNKEVLSAVRKIDREDNAKSVNFVLFHDCYLNDDDMYWLSATFNYHGPKGLAVNTVDLSNNCLTLVRDPNLTYVDLPFFSFNSPYNTPRNILRLDLSNNQIGDAGAKVVADGLANGVFPITKQINLSGNKITDKGTVTIAEALKTGKFPVLKQLDASGNDTSLVTEKFMLDALKHPSTQSIILLLKRSNDLKVVLSGSKEEKQKLIKTTLQTAQDNGVDVKNVAVSKGVGEFIKNGLSVLRDFGIGFTKCNIVPEDAETFAIEAITAKICKKTAGANAAKDAVVCFFDTIEDISTSPEGVQFIKDLDLLGANTVIDSIE